MIECVTVAGIVFYIGLIAIAPEQATEILVGAGLAVSAYVIFRPGASLKNNLSPGALRSLGIVGLTSGAADHEAVTRCVDQAVGSSWSDRGCERADCFIPVEVKRGRFRFQEYVLNLSASGIRLTSVDRPKLDTDLQVSFRLPMSSGDPIRARGRVVHQMSKRNSAGRYEVGVFFDPIDPQYRKMISREVDRLLTA